MTNSDAKQSEESLVRAACQGDRAAFAFLIERYTPCLIQFARIRTATIQDAEDIVQETFLRAYEKLSSYQSIYSFKNWLLTIAYRLMVSAARKKQPLSLHDSAACGLAADLPELPGENDWLWNIVSQLETADGTVLWFRYREDMPISDIAKIMKKTAIGVRVHLHRARRRLSEKLKTYCESNEPIPELERFLCTERSD